MLPEHIHSASTDGSLKSSPHLQETALNDIDNIITITTASINRDCNRAPITTDHTLHIKSTINNKTSHTTSEKIVQFLSKRPTPDTNSNSNASTEAASTSTTTTRKQFEFCNAAQWISFQDNIAEVNHRKGRRLNGLQLPLHPLQVLGWVVLILFGVASFWLLIPTFVVEIQGPLYGLISGLYIVHIASHLAALLIDPADRELRRVHRNDRIVPEFDRSKHTHVIENGRCHLCNIRTSSQRTKHCSVCNKCVGKFDHHCKWLNHCIGSRNYVAFLMCVVSAVIATLVIVAAVVAQIVLYYVQPDWLSFWYGNNVVLNGSVETVAFVVSSSIINDTSTVVTPNNSTFGFDFASSSNATNANVFLFEDEAYLDNATLPSLIDNLTTLITENVNESILVNFSTPTTIFETKTPTTTTPTQSATSNIISTNTTAATIAGIGISDTIFLILIGFLGLLAAITAGLLLHLCFFHIYISFLGLTTYEYIRNHRQAQEAKAKNTLSTLPKDEEQHFSSNPSKKTNDCGQMYFCSSLRHPNAVDSNDRRYFETTTREPEADNEKNSQSKLHCCANSREYHQTALKTYYMCSLLEEGTPSPPFGIAHISGGVENLYGHHRGEEVESNETENVKTFHCCSTFAATTTQRKVSAATTKATLVSDLEAAAATLNARRSYLQFTEQCTFCTFRIRSPIVAQRSASATSTRSGGRQHSAALKSELSQTSKTSSAASNAASVEHQRCCMKAISKHQRWRRKWNCCSSVPDSPDVPNDIIAALAMRHQHSGSATSANKKINATEIPVHFIKSANGSSGGGMASVSELNNRPTSPPLNANLKAQARARNSRTWPVARLRHMLRMLNRYRRPRCRHHNNAEAAAAAVINGGGGGGAEHQIKQNQIRPLHLQKHHSTTNNGCQHHHHHHYYDSSSPQPPSSTTTTTSERSSDPSIYSDSSTLTTPSSQQPNTIETILPTSVIRDDTCMTYTTPIGITLPPALPPPVRRKIPNPTDLEELAETLGFSSHPSSGGGGSMTFSSTPQRLPALNNIYRRQRRKHFLRTRSPTLSPIHESGLSNPTSPQPCRHNATNCSPSAVAAAAAVVNNLCGSSELVRKTSSNSSLHSVSSNSSST